MNITPQQLAEFLAEANRHTYAADGGRVTSSLPGAHDLEYISGNLKYHDTYFGSKRFIGMEIVYENDVPIWGMNYYGYIMVSDVDSEEIYAFLKQALMQETRNRLPVRGPDHYRQGLWHYHSGIARGEDLTNFRLFEVIFQHHKDFRTHGRRVYECECSGGLL